VTRQNKDLTRKKGKSTKHARPGNKNTAKGPRVGRATLPPPRTRRPDEPKAQPRGKPFEQGSNSHDGETFQRGRDRIPRGHIPLFYKCILSDENETLYRQVVRGIRADPRYALEFLERAGNRIDGLPTTRIEKTVQRAATFILTMPDGTTRDALPPPTPVGSGSSPTAASEEDQIILGDLVAVRP
jgi:hypothetical protein